MAWTDLTAPPWIFAFMAAFNLIVIFLILLWLRSHLPKDLDESTYKP